MIISSELSIFLGLADASAFAKRKSGQEENCMFKGQRLRLSSSTLAIDPRGCARGAVTIPVGDIVEVVSDHQDGDKMMDVVWNGRQLLMFVIDLQSRGEELPK